MAICPEVLALTERIKPPESVLNFTNMNSPIELDVL